MMAKKNVNSSVAFTVLFFILLIGGILYFSNVREGLENIADGWKRETSPIPRKIFQTWHTKNLPAKMAENVEKLKKNNPEFSHHLFDEPECRNFIETHFDKRVLSAYDCLIPKAYKADLWRLCVLYIHGGIYMDIKLNTVDGFKLTELTNREYFARDLESSGGGIWNGFIVCKPKNEKCWKCIQKIADNVERHLYGNTALTPTGPNMMKEFFTEDELNNLEISFGDQGDCPTQTCIALNGKTILYYYREYRDEQAKGKEPSYFDLWQQHKIYSCE